MAHKQISPNTDLNTTEMRNPDKEIRDKSSPGFIQKYEIQSRMQSENDSSPKKSIFSDSELRRYKVSLQKLYQERRENMQLEKAGRWLETAEGFFDTSRSSPAESGPTELSTDASCSTAVKLRAQLLFRVKTDGLWYQEFLHANRGLVRGAAARGAARPAVTAHRREKEGPKPSL